MTGGEPGRERWASLLPTLVVVALILYLLSAAASIAVAYAPDVAWRRFVTILLGLAICAGFWQAGRQRRIRVFETAGAAAGLMALGLGVAAHFAAPPAAAAMAEAVALLLPLQAAGVFLAVRDGQRGKALMLGAVLLLNAGLLLLTGERSVWLATGIGSVSATLYYARSRARSHSRGWHRVVVGWAGFLTALFLGVLAALTWPEWWADMPLLADSALGERMTVWRQMIDLTGDYRFTGSGLGMTAMVASTYLFLLHVPFYTHAHNTFLQIALEQGIVGVVGYAGMAAVTLSMAHQVCTQSSGRLRLLGICSLAALVTVIAHGLFDSELYASAWVALLFVPYGFVVGLYAYARQEKRSSRLISSRHGQPVGGTLAGATVIVVLGLLLWIALGGRSAWYANLGAVSQTRVELGVYAWPQWALQDQVRRAGMVNLQPALAAFQIALTQDADNVTAHRRLGQIALAQGDYALAQQHLLAAYAIAPHDRATQQLLGEIYALTGKRPEAVRLWQRIDVSHGQLDVRLTWYASLGNSHHLQQMQEAIDFYERGTALP